MKRLIVMACLLLFGATAPLAVTAADAYEALGIEVSRVLAGTSMTAKVDPGAQKQFVSVTSYMTGARGPDAVNVRLDIFQEVGGKLVPIYQRDFGTELGGHIAEGDLQVIDLDVDGVAEIVVSFESFASPVIQQRLGEVIVYDAEGFRTAWSGPMRYDATRAARDVPREQRDRYRRDLDLAATMRTRGEALHWSKHVTVIAGETLASPQVVDEVFPFKTVER